MSGPRFGVYLTATSGDRSRALDLYEWNTTMSAAVLHDLAHLEIAIRNAYDSALTSRAPAGAPHWTRDALRYFPVVMKKAANGAPYDANERPRKQLAAAVREAGPGAPAGKVVAELMFGFWRYLSTSAHEVSLWRPYLHRGFVPGTSRKAVDGPMARLHKLRNRVAHHEPLLREDLARRFGDVVDLAGLISSDFQVYAQTASTWSSTLARKP